MWRRLSSRRSRSSSSSRLYAGAMKPPSRALSGSSGASARPSRPVRPVSLSRPSSATISSAGNAAAAASRRARNASAAATPSRIAARSRGPPRPRLKRAKGRSRSGAARSAARVSARVSARSTNHATMSWRAAIAAGSVSGATNQPVRVRAPAPVAVRSIVASRLPLRSPARVRVSSRLRAVAASISMTAPARRWVSRLKCGKRPFWVRST